MQLSVPTEMNAEFNFENCIFQLFIETCVPYSIGQLGSLTIFLSCLTVVSITFCVPIGVTMSKFNLIKKNVQPNTRHTVNSIDEYCHVCECVRTTSVSFMCMLAGYMIKWIDWLTRSHVSLDTIAYVSCQINYVNRIETRLI